MPACARSHRRCRGSLVVTTRPSRASVVGTPRGSRSESASCAGFENDGWHKTHPVLQTSHLQRPIPVLRSEVSLYYAVFLCSLQRLNVLIQLITLGLQLPF